LKNFFFLLFLETWNGYLLISQTGSIIFEHFTCIPQCISVGGAPESVWPLQFLVFRLYPIYLFTTYRCIIDCNDSLSAYTNNIKPQHCQLLLLT